MAIEIGRQPLTKSVLMTGEDAGGSGVKSAKDRSDILFCAHRVFYFEPNILAQKRYSGWPDPFIF
jgi:hypothetical protein